MCWPPASLAWHAVTFPLAKRTVNFLLIAPFTLWEQPNQGGTATVSASATGERVGAGAGADATGYLTLRSSIWKGFCWGGGT